MLRFLKKIIVNIVLLALVATFTGCDNKENTEIVKEVKSPNGYYTAYAAICSNGATTPFEPRVAVISSKASKEDVDKLLSEGGNVYSATRSYDKKIDIKWEDDDNLLITYSNEDSDIYNKSDIFHGIKIKYKKISKWNL